MDKLFTAQFVAWTKTLLPPGMSSAFFSEMLTQLTVPQKASTYAVQDRVVPVEGGEVTVRCTVPVNEDEGMTFPLLFNIHGGCRSLHAMFARIHVLTIFAIAWVSNDISMEDYYLRRVCVDLQIAVVNVNYRYAPSYCIPRCSRAQLSKSGSRTPVSDSRKRLPRGAEMGTFHSAMFYCYHALSYPAPIIDGRERATP